VDRTLGEISPPMATPYSRITLLGQQQRNQKMSDDSRFSKSSSGSSSPASTGLGLFQTKSEYLRIVPTIDKKIKDNLEQKAKLDLLFKMKKSFLSTDVDTILKSIYSHIEYRCMKTKWSFTSPTAYDATALSIRDRIVEFWNDTNRVFHEKKPKRVYYLSIEFLIGRLLRSNVLSLGFNDLYYFIFSFLKVFGIIILRLLIKLGLHVILIFNFFLFI
jgi:hypothetical protein